MDRASTNRDSKNTEIVPSISLMMSLASTDGNISKVMSAYEGVVAIRSMVPFSILAFARLRKATIWLFVTDHVSARNIIKQLLRD